MPRSTKDIAALSLIGFLGLFLVGSLVVVIFLAFTGAGGGEDLWSGLFALITAILGAIVGWLGGTAVEAQKHQPEIEQPSGFDDGNPIVGGDNDTLF